MKRNFYRLSLFMACSLFVAGCGEKEPGNEKLIKKWQAVSVEDSQLDETIKDQELFMDTVGRDMSPAELSAAFGFTSRDSMVADLSRQINQFKQLQDQAIRETWMQFFPDKLAVMHSMRATDTATWSMASDTLILDKSQWRGLGAPSRMRVVSLEDSLLKLQMLSQGNNVTITFKPADN
jgi:hypothetical protein